MVERRVIGRIHYESEGVVVVCDTQEVIHVDVKDMGPAGVGCLIVGGHESLLGKKVIIVAETVILYAEVVRQKEQEDGSFLGLHAERFTKDVLQFLFNSIEDYSADGEKA